MLILVVVTINMAINGGLFESAGKASRDTKKEILAEQNLSKGELNVDGKLYESIDDYIDGNEKITLPEGWEKTETIPTGWDGKKVTVITDGEHEVPLPKGYRISSVPTEQAVVTGLVIKDSNNNEFVWIPVSGNLSSQYSSRSGYSEPKDFSSNVQRNLDHYYGENYFNYTEDFRNEEEYAQMVESVDKYHGFYIGRYETTIDSDGHIGSVYNTPVLTSDKIIKEGSNPHNDDPYYYRWYGLYYVQKTTSYVVGNGKNIQTAMIYGQLWDKTMEYIRIQKTAGNTTYDVDTANASRHVGVPIVNSGANINDIVLNIYDLEGNGWDWTQEAEDRGNGQVVRGGNFGNKQSASFSNFYPASFDPIAIVRCKYILVTFSTLYKIVVNKKN